MADDETTDAPDWSDEPVSDEMMDDEALDQAKEAEPESLDF